MPSNPLTQARKLGFPLVNSDGFLTGLAKAHFGSGPMDQIKIALQARQDFDAQAERELNQRKGEQGLLKGDLDLRTGEYNLGRAGVEDTQKDAVFGQTQTQRKARGIALGGTETDPDTAIGAFDAKADMQRAFPKEHVLPEFAKLAGMPTLADKDIDSSQLGQMSTMINQKNAQQARVDAANIAAQSRRDAQQGITERAGDNRRQNLIGKISTGLQSNEAFKKYISVNAEANGLRTLLRTAANDPNGTSDIAIVNMFQRLADPGVAVREGDVALIQSAQGILPRVANISEWLSQGNRLTPETRQNMLALIQPIVEARKNAAREAIIDPSMRRARANQLPLDEIFPDEFLNEDQPQSSGLLSGWVPSSKRGKQ